MSSNCDSGAGFRKGDDKLGGIRCEVVAEERSRRKEVERRVKMPAIKQKRVSAGALVRRRRVKVAQTGLVGELSGEYMAGILTAMDRCDDWNEVK